MTTKNRTTAKPNTTTTTAADPWMNTKDACGHLRISVPTLRRWITAGKLVARKTPGGSLRFRQGDLDNLIG